MRSPVTGLLLCVVLLALVFQDAWRKRHDKTAGDWVMLLAGTAMLSVGSLLRLTYPTIGTERYAASGILRMAGAVIVLVPLLHTIKRPRPPIQDVRLLRICKHTALALVVAVVGLGASFPLLSVWFPDLEASAARLIGTSLRATLAISGSIYTTAFVVWYQLMKRRPFPSPITRKALALGVPLLVVAAYVPAMLMVRAAATECMVPSVVIASSFLMVGLTAVAEAALISCYLWLALWGLAAGA